MIVIDRWLLVVVWIAHRLSVCLLVKTDEQMLERWSALCEAAWAALRDKGSKEHDIQLNC
jgi:hypothetical protein